ncbi:MAG: glycoside hydrolase family 31 protein [Chthoniobacteraceae bacterium]|nr:glycoside hydrolase family 31 protein [Chthoniobacteraceae bacterium]
MIRTSCIETAPGVWKLTLGSGERITPFQVLSRRAAVDRMAMLPKAGCCPLDAGQITTRKTRRGFEVHLPLAPDEQIYGLGLQLLSFRQTGLKKTLRVNSDPRCDLGDSHAPVPFYVTTGGYGVLVDTARYATFYCGSTQRPAAPRETGPQRGIALTTEALYAARNSAEFREMIVEIPGAEGVDLYLFAGPEMGNAVQRYNLFSGGGCVPPRWALGPWYRVRGDFSQAQITAFTQQLREEKIPCDVLGVEPGWQTHAYACSHVWSEKFPDPAGFVASLRAEHFRVNLWTHAFTAPSSPIYGALLPHAANYTVFGGLVPDMLDGEGRKLFTEHYRKTTVVLGVSGYKIDECDGSDFIHSPWSFPELSEFPSGADGEQMHSLFGLLLQDSAARLYHSEERRTFGLVRNSHAFAAAQPFALYSDLYDHRQFVRGIVNASFSGLLWCPEVRESASGGELVRRLQTAVVSPILQINGWYIANPPWKQWAVDANNNGEFVPGWEAWQERCRGILELRMRLIPYLHAAFFRYWRDGIPPFRALVFDYPSESESRGIDDEVLIGDRLLAAPLIDDGPPRRLWLPPGAWADFWTAEIHEGGKFVDFPVVEGRFPLFVKSGSVLALAFPTLHTDDPRAFHLEVSIYGDGALPAALLEEYAPDRPFDRNQANLVHLAWNSQKEELSCTREDPHSRPLYSVSSVRFPGKEQERLS